MGLHKSLENYVKNLNSSELENLFNLISSLIITPAYSYDFGKDISVKTVEQYLMKEYLLLFRVQNYHLINDLST